MRILVVKPSSMGDIVHVFPALEMLHESYPDAELHFLVHPAFDELLRYSPFPVSRIIHFHRRELGSLKTFPGAFLKLFRALRKDPYDLVIDMQGLLRSAFFARLARSKRHIGFAAPREKMAGLFYSERYAVPEGHAVERNTALVAALVGKKWSGIWPRPGRVPIFEEGADRILAAHHIPQDAELISMVVGARWRSKRFPTHLFVELAERLVQNHPKAWFLLIGSRSDCYVAEKIMRLYDREKMIDLTGGTTIGEMAEVLRRSALVFSNDSGPMHLAAMFDRRLIAFFGPTNPDKTGPSGASVCRVFRRELSCRSCMKRSCPKGRTYCHELNASEIAECAEDFLGNPSREGDGK